MLDIVTRRTRTFDIRMPFQLIRHSSLAKRARQWIYYLAIGKDGYPFVFRQVEEGEELPHVTSPHVYIHIPFCRSLCIHCPYNKVIFRNESYISYAKALERELRCYVAQQDIPPIQTLYFGGGTPSMTPELIQQVITLTRAKCAEHVEIGLEVHPRDATIERLEQLSSMESIASVWASRPFKMPS